MELMTSKIKRIITVAAVGLLLVNSSNLLLTLHLCDDGRHHGQSREHDDRDGRETCPVCTDLLIGAKAFHPALPTEVVLSGEVFLYHVEPVFEYVENRPVFSMRIRPPPFDPFC